MSSLAAGVILMSMGIQPVLQVTCRDRNRLALQSDLLGAAALGLNTVLLLTGDHQSFGNHRDAKGVWGLDSVKLIQLVKRMRDSGKFENGEPLNGPRPSFFIGAVESPCGEPRAFRAARLQKKSASGADFCQTQAIYDVPRFGEWMKQARDLDIPAGCAILVGVTPLRSASGARYVNANGPGLDVPEAIVRRLDGAGNRKAQQREGIRIAVETIQQLREISGVAGVHMMTVHWEHAVPIIAQKADLLPRPSVEI